MADTEKKDENNTPASNEQALVASDTPQPTPTTPPQKTTTPEEPVGTPVEDQAAIAQQEEAARKQAEEEALAAEEIRIPEIRPGMTVRVYQKIKEGDKERIQVFQGIVTALRGKTADTKTMTVQKRSFGVLVEKIYPLASPIVEKIEIVKKAKVRRSKLYFLGSYAKRLKETLVKH